MALELETTIMEEIGLGNHYNWYSGSGSCLPIRTQAVNKLAEVIKAHADAGDEITQPHKPLIDLVRVVARNREMSSYSLTNTWKVCSYIIAAHIHAVSNPAAFSQTKELIKEQFLGQTMVNPFISPLGNFTERTK